MFLRGRAGLVGSERAALKISNALQATFSIVSGLSFLHFVIIATVIGELHRLSLYDKTVVLVAFYTCCLRSSVIMCSLLWCKWPFLVICL